MNIYHPRIPRGDSVRYINDLASGITPGYASGITPGYPRMNIYTRNKFLANKMARLPLLWPTISYSVEQVLGQEKLCDQPF